MRGGITSLGDFILEPANVLPYNAQFVPKVRDVNGDFDGVGWTNQADHVDPDHTLYNVFHPSSPTTYYLGLGEDKRMTQFINDQRKTVDPKKRAEILKDFQRYAATKMYLVPPPGDIKPFHLYQPWVGNFDYHVPWIAGAFAGGMDSQGLYTYRWLDESKRTARS
jgi:ABC-type transport system substrate-binding protein